METPVQADSPESTEFERIRHTTKDGEEYWLARELSTALEYKRWETFEGLISRARIAMERAGMPVENHFRDFTKMVQVGSAAAREIDDVKLTRLACYVIAQNGNPTKKARVAEAQSYFAIQTRKQELTEVYLEDMKRLAIRQEFSVADKRLSESVVEAGIHPTGLGIIKSDGDKVFFGGNTSKSMKVKYGITTEKTPWANRAPNVVLAGKTLANEMTSTNIQHRGIGTFPAVLTENSDNNARVRKALMDSGIVPEEQPAAEDTEDIKKRIGLAKKISPKKRVAEDETFELDL